jgi:hypothetical protein
MKFCIVVLKFPKVVVKLPTTAIMKFSTALD